MPERDVLDIILRLQNVAAVRAGLAETAAGVSSVGKAGTASSRNIAGMQRNSQFLTATMGLLKKASIGAGAAMALAAVEGTKMAINYDAAIERLHTQAGLSQRLVPGLNRELLSMAQSGQYAQGPQALADGLYHLISVGMPAAKALVALRVAAQGAAVGGANLEDVTTAMASAWLVGIKGAGSFQHVMALTNATVGAGNMRMEDLVQSLGTGVLASAKTAGLGIQDVYSALAILSDEGFRGSSAMAQFATALHFFTNPGKKAADALASIGLSSTDLAVEMHKPEGLFNTLRMLHDHLRGLSDVQKEQVLGNILPGGRGRVMLVLLNQLDRLDMKYHQISRTTSQYGDDVKKTHRTAAWQIHAAWSVVQADLIILGHILEPVMVDAIKLFSKTVTWLLYIPTHLQRVIRWWDKLPWPIKAAGEFVGILTGLVITYFAVSKGIAAVTILWSMMSSAIETAQIAMLILMDNPIIAMLAAIAAGLVVLYLNWKPFRKVVDDVWKVTKGFVDFVDKLLGRLGPAGQVIRLFFLAWLAWKAVGFLSMGRALLGARAAMIAAASTSGIAAGEVAAATTAEETGSLVLGKFMLGRGAFAAVGRFLGSAIGAAAGPVLVGLLLAAAEQAYAHVLGGAMDVLSAPADTKVAELSDPSLQHAEKVIHSPKYLAKSRASYQGFYSSHPSLVPLRDEYVRDQNKIFGHWDSNQNLIQSAHDISMMHRNSKRLDQLAKILKAAHAPGFAYGGIQTVHGWSLVGERGPEMIELPGGARVTPLATNTRAGAKLMPVPVDSAITGAAGSHAAAGNTYILQVVVSRRVLAEATFGQAELEAARK